MTKWQKFLDRLITFIIPLCTIMVFIILPLYYTMVISLKREGDILKSPIEYFPNPFTLDNYVTAWKNVGFNTFFLNSVFVSFFAVIFIIVFSMLVGYALSRFRFKGRKSFMFILLSTQFIPRSMLLIPLFIIFRNMNLIGSLLSLIISYTTFQLPFNSIVMKGFISNIPPELEEAAMIDGCSRTSAIFRVVMPILLPGLVATGTFAFIGCWNEFLFALMFISDGSKFTLPVGLSYMLGQFDVNYGALAAGSVITLLPAMFLFGYAQKFLVSGLASGSVKG